MIDVGSGVAKNKAPGTAVARENAIAWPRPVMELPVPPPAPSAPPSERCKRTTTISETTIESDDDQNGWHEDLRQAKRFAAGPAP